VVATPDTAPAVALCEVEFALTELLENAIQHAEEAPEVTVDVSVDADGLTVTVADRTSPIPEFESSVLTGDHEMSDIYHSTGLGLWLVYWVVELSDGHVAVAERADGGNRIVVHLPTPEE
jgi:signal transduction histidine kinase